MTTGTELWREPRGRAMRTLLEAASSLLLASAKRALAGARVLWRSLPRSVREWVGRAWRMS